MFRYHGPFYASEREEIWDNIPHIYPPTHCLQHVADIPTPSRYQSVDHFQREKHHPEYQDYKILASLSQHRYQGELELREGMKVY